MKTNLVSVIVPVFNGERHIEQCLTSLGRQTHPALETIVVDDGSTDNTPVLLRRIAKSTPALKVISLASNGGVHAARQQGLAHAQGELIGFVDADDWVEPSMYGRLNAELTQHSADLTLCNANSVTNSGQHRGLRVRLRRAGIVETDLFASFCSLELGSGVLWNKLYRRKIIDRAFSHSISEVLPAGEDYLINISVFTEARRIALVADPLYNCRADPESVSRCGSNARGFSRTLRAYVVALESYGQLGEQALKGIDELFTRQLRYNSYSLDSAAELFPYEESVRDSLLRLAAVRPHAIYTLIHAFELFRTQPTPQQELRQSLRAALHAGRRLLTGASHV